MACRAGSGMWKQGGMMAAEARTRAIAIRDEARDRWREVNEKRANVCLEEIGWEAFYAGFLSGATAVHESRI